MANGRHARRFKQEMDRAFNLQVVEEFNLLQRTIAEQAYRKVVELSPVWSGRYRGSHRLEIDGVDESILPPYAGPERWPEPVPEGKQFRALGASEIQAKILKLEPFGRVTISNSLPYANALEDGHSKQAPSGVYTRAAMAINSKFKRVRTARRLQG